jgi:hypothetical protein
VSAVAPEQDLTMAWWRLIYALRSLIANADIFLELPGDPYKSELSAIDKPVSF